MSGTSSGFPYKGILAIILLTTTTRRADAAIGYDCETKLPNKTISLKDSINDCDVYAEAETSTEDIALLQLNEFGNAFVLQCKIEIRSAIYHCERLPWLVTHSTSEYIYPISRKECEIAHANGTMKIGSAIIDGLSVDAITTRNVTLAGIFDSSFDSTVRACIGANYTDPYGTWNNVAVTGTVKITLKRRLAGVKVDNDTIYLPSGHQCRLSKEQCIDSDGGFTFRETLPIRFCNPNMYSTLYKGSATKITSLTGENKVYSVVVDDTRFVFSTVGNETSCGATLLKTEYPKLFIIESNDLKRLEEFNIIGTNTDMLDIYQYKNAKYIHEVMYRLHPGNYLYLYIYLDVIQQKCQHEKKNLKNMLAIASTHPDEFAFQYMGGFGYTAVMEEYSLHIVQCVPVEVKLEQMNKCYNRLPILRRDQRLFMTPQTHIITKTADELPCDSPLLQYSELESTLDKIVQKPEGSASISRLKPETTLTWKFEDMGNLFTAGIYTDKQLSDWQLNQQHPKIFNPPPVLNQAFPIVNGDMHRLHSVKSLISHPDRVDSNSQWYETWNIYSVTALVSVSVNSILVIIFIIKMVSNRQRRLRMEADHHDLAINL